MTSGRTPTTGQWTAESLPSLSGPSLSLTFQRPRPAAAASLAAIWIEHQADSVFKFLESTPVFQGNALSDDKAIHVAETAHDFASLDTAIMQAVRDAESGVHRIVLSTSNLVAPQDANDHENVATALVAQANSTLVNGPDGNNANLANGFNPTANNDHAVVAHSDPISNDSDSAVASGIPQPVVAPAILIASQLTPSPQPSSSLGTIVETSEAAIQLTVSDTLSASIQAVDLSQLTVEALVQLIVSDTPSAPIQPVALHPTVKAFLHNTPSFEVLASGSKVTIVDTKLSDAASPHFGVLTWDLSNGSTLSIVGIIPHHHATSDAA